MTEVNLMSDGTPKTRLHHLRALTRRGAVLGAAVLAFSGLAMSSANAQTGSITEFSTPTADSQPLDIAPGHDGSLWFTETKADKIARITPDGRITEFGAGITKGAAPAFITRGHDGNIWFTEGFATDGTGPAPTKVQIGRITPHGKVTEFSEGLNPADGINYITAGPDGNVWFTQDRAASSAVSPRTARSRRSARASPPAVRSRTSPPARTAISGSPSRRTGSGASPRGAR